MDDVARHLDRIDRAVGEIMAVSRVLLFLIEELDQGERERLKPGTVTMLYDIIDKANSASREVGLIGSGG
jgi:hypothetical protein